MDKKTIPVLFERKEDCCGCSACVSICPSGAIEMRADDEGFAYPCIDAQRCVCCRKCVQVCPVRTERQRCAKNA